MSTSLWPNLSASTTTPGMREMLYRAAGDIDTQTNGKIQFYIDSIGIGNSRVISDVRHNCYLRTARTGYMILLFRVTAGVHGPWPARADTPEGETYPDIQDENELRNKIGEILQRERTKEIVLFLLSTVPSP